MVVRLPSITLSSQKTEIRGLDHATYSLLRIMLHPPLLLQVSQCLPGRVRPKKNITGV